MTERLPVGTRVVLTGDNYNPRCGRKGWRGVITADDGWSFDVTFENGEQWWVDAEVVAPLAPLGGTMVENAHHQTFDADPLPTLEAVTPWDLFAAAALPAGECSLDYVHRAAQVADLMMAERTRRLTTSPTPATLPEVNISQGETTDGTDER